MTVQEALARAKQLKEERTRNESNRVPEVTRRAGTPTDLETSAPLVFPQLEVDPAVCQNNRVLLSREHAVGYSSVVDSYRILRTRLATRASAAGPAWNSFGVVSAGPGEGKSVTSINLALAFAREKKRNVFLLDLDLRNPSICRYLGVAPPVSIGEVLTRQARPQDVFFGIGVDSLILAGGFTSHENSSELLGGAGMAALFQYIQQVDPQAMILADLPPLLISADALVVAPKLSAVVLVVAEGLTRREQLDRTVEVLAGASIAGIVLNRSRESVEDYYS